MSPDGPGRACMSTVYDRHNIGPLEADTPMTLVASGMVGKRLHFYDLVAAE